MADDRAKRAPRPGVKPLEKDHTVSTSAEIDSRELFQTQNALHIRHDGERYTLRRTSKGKLILTK